MIAEIKGTVKRVKADSVIIENQGLGFEVSVPVRLAEKAEPGQELTLFTQLLFRNENFQLIGFIDNTEKELFNMLLTVSGVGPRMALAFLSRYDSNELLNIIFDEDAARLSDVPGVGYKTAQRVILELNDKISKIEPDSGARKEESSGQARQLIESALVNLGYSRKEASRAAGETSVREAGSFEEGIRNALKHLSPGK